MMERAGLVEAAPAASARSAVSPKAASRIADFAELTKPRITGMVMVAALVGFVMGAPGRVDPLSLALAVIGTTLVTAGAQALNQLLERRTDAMMRRTADRPLPAARLTPAEAAVTGALLAAAGLLVLAAGANLPAVLLAAFALVSYLAVYTPLKRRSALATVVGAVPGAMPPVIGWAAARGGLGAGAVALFLILFVWQLPHFLAISWMYRDDYAKAGFPLLAVLDPDGRRTGRHAVAWCLAMIPVSLLPAALGQTGVLYAAGAAVLGLVYLWAGAGLLRHRTVARARALLLTSVMYLPALMALMAFDRAAP